MGKIVVVGLGPGDLGLLTLAGWELLAGNNALFLRTEKHPVVAQLKEKGIKWQSFDWVYENKESFELVYEQITEILLAEAAEKDIVYGVPGHPMVAETTVAMLLQRGQKLNIEISLVPGMSFLDACYNALKIDPAKGLVVHDGLILSGQALILDKGQLICQVYNKIVASEVKLTLMDKLPDDYLISVVTAAGIPELEKVWQVPLFELDRLDGLNHLTSIYIPPQDCLKQAAAYSLDPIAAVVAELRGENGCPWDREQDHSTITRNLIEEAYEVIEAIEEKNMYKLCDELGDLLLQIVFHAQIAKENNNFNLNDVVAAITAKMIRRHPHVFGEKEADTSAEVLKNWDLIKKEEQLAQGIINQSVLNVPTCLPALMKAQKLQQQAAKVGFDWPDIKSLMPKIKEEWDELMAAIAKADEENIKEEFGDVLFALVNLARFLKIDAEDGLRQTCIKFTARFMLMEQETREKNLDLSSLNLHELEILWEKAKNSQKRAKKQGNNCLLAGD